MATTPSSKVLHPTAVALAARFGLDEDEQRALDVMLRRKTGASYRGIAKATGMPLDKLILAMRQLIDRGLLRAWRRPGSSKLAFFVRMPGTD